MGKVDIQFSEYGLSEINLPSMNSTDLDIEQKRKKLKSVKVYFYIVEFSQLLDVAFGSVDFNSVTNFWFQNFYS